MNFIQSLILAIIGSSALSASITALINAAHDRKKKESEEETAKTAAIMFLLAGSIRHECQEHINDGDVAAEDLNRLEKAWKIYHDGLGGNGFLDTYMSDVRALPKRKEY